MKRLASAALFLTPILLPLLNISCANNPAGGSGPTPTPTVSYSVGVSFGSSGAITMDSPWGVAFDGTNLWVTNQNNNSLQEWTTAGVAVTQVTTFNTSQTFNRPYALGAGPDGYLYVGDANNSRIVEFSPAAAYVTQFGSTELGTDTSYGVAVGSNYAYVTDDTTKYVFRYTVTGSGATKTFQYPTSFVAANAGVTLNPSDVGLDSFGDPFVVGIGGSQVMAFNPSGTFRMAVTQNVAAPGGVALDGAGDIFIAQTGPGITPTPTLNQYDPSGNFVKSYGAGLLSNPGEVALDNTGNLYVADGGHNQVIQFRKN